MSFDLGFIHYDAKNGLKVRPQLKFAATSPGANNVGFSFGLGDLRDGIDVGAKAGAELVYEAFAQSYDDMIVKCRGYARNLKTGQSAAVKYLLNHVINSQDVIFAKAFQIMPINPRTGNKLNINQMFPVANVLYFKVTVDVKVGAGGKLNLGWKDTKGFHMSGGEVDVDVIAELAIGYQFGWHHKEDKFRVIIRCHNVILETIMDV